jgi:hypothetical protein
MRSNVRLEHLRDLERRRSLRFVLPCQEDIAVTVGGRRFHAKLEDISIGGAKLSLDADVDLSGEVHLEHATAGAIDGVCLWHRDQAVGISFALSDPALRLISLCLRQGVPSSTFAA